MPCQRGQNNRQGGMTQARHQAGNPQRRDVQEKQIPHASGTECGHAIQGDGARLHLHMIPTSAITATTHHRRWSDMVPVCVSPYTGSAWAP